MGSKSDSTKVSSKVSTVCAAGTLCAALRWTALRFLAAASLGLVAASRDSLITPSRVSFSLEFGHTCAFAALHD